MHNAIHCNCVIDVDKVMNEQLKCKYRMRAHINL